MPIYINVSIAGSSVVKVNCVKCLGVIIKERLSWGTHSGAGTIFQQGGQDQPFSAGGAVSPQRGLGQSPGGKRILTTIF